IRPDPPSAFTLLRRRPRSASLGELSIRPIVFRRTALDVAVESDRAALFPILGVVFFDSRSVTQEAVKLSLLWVNNDPDMPSPNDQVAGLRFFYAPKVPGSPV